MDRLALRLDAVRWHDHQGLGGGINARRANCHARFRLDRKSQRQAVAFRRNAPAFGRPFLIAMDYVVLIFAGVIMGLIAAVPIGPVNLICVRRTFAFGPLNGFVSGLGAALGDGIFAAINGFGLTWIANLIEGYATIIELICGALLLIIGDRMF